MLRHNLKIRGVLIPLFPDFGAIANGCFFAVADNRSFKKLAVFKKLFFNSFFTCKILYEMLFISL